MAFFLSVDEELMLALESIHGGYGYESCPLK